MLYLALHMRSLYEFDQKMNTVLRRLWMKRLKRNPLKV
jgi:hypothetical protein